MFQTNSLEPVVISPMPQEISEVSYDSGYNKIISATSQIFVTAWNLASNGTSLAYDYCTNPNHPWKVQKYALGLQQITKGVKFLTGLSIGEWGEFLEKESTPLNNEVLELIKILLEENVDDIRSQYKNFIFRLRTILLSSIYSEQAEFKVQGEPYDRGLDLISDICLARFQETHIYPFCEYIVFKMIRAGQRSLGVGISENNALNNEDFLAIKAAPRKYKAQQIAVDKYRLFGTFNRWFDPQLSSNLPFVLGDFDILGSDSRKAVRLLRIGTPTLSDFQGNTSIIPEFRCFIERRSHQNQKHLYISLQSDLKGNREIEFVRNDTIKQLASSFPDCFFVVVLAQDSPFYNQTGEFNAQICQVEDFLDAFKKQINQENVGFYFPERWLKDKTFQVAIDQLFTLTLEAMFENIPETLTIEERKDFIELFYVYLELFLLKYCDADSCNITCRDAIDRAGKNNSLLIRFLNIAQGYAHSPTHMRKHKVFTHAPALIVKKQAIIEERKARLMSALAYMDSPNMQAKIRMQAINGLIPIDPQGDFIIEDTEIQSKEAFEKESFYQIYKKQKEVML